MQSNLTFSGKLQARHIPGALKAPLLWKLANFPRILPGLFKERLARALNMAHFSGKLYARHLQANGRIVDYGLVSTKLVTTVFVNFLVDQLQTETSVIGDFKFHDSGVGTTAAAIGDTDIETTDAVARATGSQEEGASANIYKSIGTITYGSTLSITENGLFSIITGGTLMDRHVFTAIGVENLDSIEFTYNLTVSAGG